MRIKVFSKTWEGMITTSTFLRASNIVLAVCLLAATFGILKQEPVVTLVPPGLTKEASIGLRTADANYMMSFGMYVASLTGNITPNNALLVADALGSIVEPQLYSQVRRELYALANDPAFRDRGGAIFFEPMDVLYDAQTGKVFVKGNQVSVTSSGEQNRKPFVYEIQVKVRDHMPMILAFDKYTGQPRTLEWQSKHRTEAARIEQEQANKDEVGATPWFTDAIRYGSDESASTKSEGEDHRTIIQPTTHGENQ